MHGCQGHHTHKTTPFEVSSLFVNLLFYTTDVRALVALDARQCSTLLNRITQNSRAGYHDTFFALLFPDRVGDGLFATFANVFFMFFETDKYSAFAGHDILAEGFDLGPALAGNVCDCHR